MASRLTNQFFNSLNANVTYIEGSIAIGASGAIAPSTGVVGRGMSSTGCQQNATGQYQLTFADNYNRLLGFDVTPISPTSAAGSITDGHLIVGKAYQITFASTSTNFNVLGLPSNLTAQAGMSFVATSGASNGSTNGGVGNGTVTPVGLSGIASIEVLPNPNLTLNPVPTRGAVVQFQTLNSSGALASPTSGTVLRFGALFRNSTLLGTNETSSNY